MAPSNKGNNDSHLMDELIHDLETTANQVQDLLREIRDSEVDFAAVKTELRILVENFKELSSLIRNGDGKVSILTRMALVEKSIAEIEEWIVKVEDRKAEADKTSATVKVAQETGKWQVTTAIATGVLALIASTVGLIIDMLSK